MSNRYFEVEAVETPEPSEKLLMSQKIIKALRGLSECHTDLRIEKIVAEQWNEEGGNTYSYVHYIYYSHTGVKDDE